MRYFFLLFTILLFPIVVWAQEGETVILENVQVFVDQLSWLNAIAVPLVIYATQMFKKHIWPNIPKTLLPLVAVAVGIGIQFVGSLVFEGVDFMAFAALLNGTLGVTSRDVLRGFVKDAGMAAKESEDAATNSGP